MLDRYGLAVIQERTEPRRWDGVAAYLRQEYGPGTSPGYLWATDGLRRASRGRVREAWGRLVARVLRRGRLSTPDPARPPRRQPRDCEGIAATEP